MTVEQLPIRMVLITPEIPGNTGAIARTCAGTNTPLDLVGKLGFSLEDKYVRRAGLDYWPSVHLQQHASFDAFRAAQPEGKIWLFTKRAPRTLWDVSFSPGDALVFGCETKGLPKEMLEAHPEQCVRIPITEGVRSLNLANAASVALYEALRQTGWTAPAHDL